MNQTSKPSPSADETALDVWPLEAPERAVRFIAFLHHEAQASDVDLEPSADGRYHFRVSVPSGSVVAALLASSEFFPEKLHSTASGPLDIQLSAGEARSRAAPRPVPEPASSNSGSTGRGSADSAGGVSSLVSAFENLDQALDGETSDQPSH